jgi:endogenous inhibitor of DNA gyrase (YacG/DUF329 family)
MANQHRVAARSNIAKQCPICGKPAVARHQPFCSARCADIDLGRWLKGAYSIPTDEPPEDAPLGGQREE